MLGKKRENLPNDAKTVKIHNKVRKLTNLFKKLEIDSSKFLNEFDNQKIVSYDWKMTSLTTG